MKREANGLSSRHLHDALRVGDALDVTAPAGKFTFTGAEATRLVLVAGGVGLTPLMAKVRYLTDLGWPGGITLIYSAKTEADIIFRGELAALAARHPNLKVAVTLTRETGPEWRGERGRVTPELLARLVPDIASQRVHICGPTEMTDPTRAMLLALGVPAAMVQVESFASPSRGAAGAGLAPAAMPASGIDINEAATGASVGFVRSGKASPAPPSKTVLELAEDLGVGIDYDCRSGICGQCKVRLLSGRVAMDAEDALSPSDKAAGLILACQSRCLDVVEVDA